MRAFFKCTAALAILAVAACAPIEDPNATETPGPIGGGGPTPITFTFQLPPDQSTVDTVTTVSASGAELRRAQFEMDGAVVAEDLLAPFEWTLDPGDWVIGPDNPHVLTIRGFTATGTEDAKTVTLKLDRAVPLQEIQDAIANLSPSFWYEIPNSRLANVGWHDPLQRWGLPGIIEAASGAAYDTKRDRLVIWGGGHDYGGNEIYVFDVNTARWERITDPSDYPEDDPRNEKGAAFTPDGRPVARHTYDTLEYLPPPVDRLFAAGGSIFFGTNPGSDGRTHYFDFDGNVWETTVAEQALPLSPGACTALAPDGRVWQQRTEGVAHLSVYDPATRTWTVHVTYPTFYNIDSVAEIDPVRNLFLTVGNGATYVWDLNNPDQQPTALPTTGDTEIESVRCGLAYHPPSDRIFAWTGGGAMYVLDVDAARWTRHPSVGSVDPGAQAQRGTYGRFRYIPSLDVFIVVSSVYENVFVYRAPVIP